MLNRAEELFKDKTLHFDLGTCFQGPVQAVSQERAWGSWCQHFHSLQPKKGCCELSSFNVPVRGATGWRWLKVCRTRDPELALSDLPATLSAGTLPVFSLR